MPDNSRIERHCATDSVLFDAMTDADSTLGRCPHCGKTLSPAYLLVEYEMDDGDTGIWAECPVCDDVVDPD